MAVNPLVGAKVSDLQGTGDRKRLPPVEVFQDSAYSTWYFQGFSKQGASVPPPLTCLFGKRLADRAVTRALAGHENQHTKARICLLYHLKTQHCNSNVFLPKCMIIVNQKEFASFLNTQI